MASQASVAASIGTSKGTPSPNPLTSINAVSSHRPAADRLARLIWSASGLDLEPAASPTCGMARMISRGKLREATWAANRPQHMAGRSTEPINASRDTFTSTTSTSASAPKAPTRESFMISKARSRALLPPSPSATSASPSSWKAPVSNTPSTVPRAAITSGVMAVSGSTHASTTLADATRPPTNQPTPGKCAALARSMAGL